MTKTVIIKVDPYNRNTSLAIPQIVPRFTEVLSQFGDEQDSVAINFFPRLWAKDPGVLLLAAVEPDTGKVKGFTAAAINSRECLLLQPRLDEPTENDAVSEMIEAVEDWAKSLQFTSITLVSRRADPKWMKKHGFEITRYIATKELE